MCAALAGASGCLGRLEPVLAEGGEVDGEVDGVGDVMRE